ncbi:hypothetical protein O9993_10375 [Vibrio lentus]|nr:hypothetical protein [Vibrio lentus]
MATGTMSETVTARTLFNEQRMNLLAKPGVKACKQHHLFVYSRTSNKTLPSLMMMLPEACHVSKDSCLYRLVNVPAGSV